MVRSSTNFGSDRIVATVIFMTALVILIMYFSESWEFPFP